MLPMPDGTHKEPTGARARARVRIRVPPHDGAAPDEGGLSPTHQLLTSLQRSVGNQAVMQLVENAATLQRQAITEPGTAGPANLAPRGLPGLGGGPPDPSLLETAPKRTKPEGTKPETEGTADPANLAPIGLPGLGGGPPDRSLLETAPEPSPAGGTPAPGGGWDLEYTVYGTPEKFSGLTDRQAVEKLESFYMSLLDDARNGEKRQRSWQEEFGGSFSSRWAAGVASIAGGADWPDVSRWSAVAEYMADAGQMLRESQWAAMVAAGEGASMDEAARRAAVPVDEQRVQAIVTILEEGDRRLDKAEKDWEAFLKDADKGASRAVTGLKVAKVAGAVAATALTGGAAGALELGAMGTAGLVAVGGGTYAATQNLAGQVGEIIFSDRTSIDWGSVAKEGAIAAAAGFVGGAVGGKLAGTIGNGLGKLVGDMAPETMEAFGITGAELLTGGEKLFARWAGTTLATPFSTTTQVLIQTAIDGKWPVTSVGDFFDLVLTNMVESGAINGFFTFVRANSRAPAPPVGREGGPPDGGSSGGGGGGGGGGGVPVHVGPEGDAYLDPSVSTGVPEPIGPGYEPTLPMRPGYEPTLPMGPVSTGVPEPIGPGGDVSVPPGTVSGIPEYIGPGAEPTQPMGPGTTPAPPAGGTPRPSTTLVEEDGASTRTRTRAEGDDQSSRAESRESGEGDEVMSWAEELRWIYRPPGLKAIVLDHVVSDPVELTQLVSKANSYGAQVIRVDGMTPEGAARLEQLWHAYAQEGAAPTAWVDTFGNVIVDEAAHPEINSLSVLQGPTREP